MSARFIAVVGAALVAVGCTQHHQARIHPTPVPPPPVAMVPHSGRLWLDVRSQTPDRQCVQPGSERSLCFARVSDSLGEMLERTLWPSFPKVAVKRRSDNLMPGDYVLLVELTLDALPGDEKGPGWSAGARGSWQLVRDGIPLSGETLASRSRSEFPYGASLGQGAGEVVSAIAVHIASTIGQYPESRPMAGVPLPAVLAEPRLGPRAPSSPKLSASR